MRIKSVILCLSLALLSACSSKVETVTTYEPISQSADIIKDTREIPQDVLYFVGQLSQPQSLLATKESSKAMYDRFMKNMYSAWNIEKGSIKLKDIEYLFTRSNKGYAENLLPWDSKRWNDMHKNASLSNFPNNARKAIVLNPTSVRELPTLSPRFSNPLKAGSGYPFDLFQYATLPVGMPVFVSHTSVDKAWSFIETSLFAGWVLTEDIAYVDDAFIQAWKQPSMGAFTEEKVSLVYNNRFLTYASIGTVLPYQNNQVYVPVIDIPRNTASIVQVPVSSSVIHSFPLPFTANNVGVLASKVMNQPYGWGASLDNRDCSAFMRDLFIPFGVWLPRNSLPQSQVGEVVSLEGMSLKSKERRIIEEAKPFASLLYLPGHIGLYIGTYKNKAVFLHDAWGIRTYDDDRLIIGRVAITSLEPGKEDYRTDPSKTLLSRMTRFNIIGQ